MYPSIHVAIVFYPFQAIKTNKETRMHSSRMCTARFNGVYPGGCVCPGAVHYPGPKGRHSPPPQRQTPPPPVNRMTDRCKNITFPQLHLRAVMTNYCSVTEHHTFGLSYNIEIGKQHSVEIHKGLLKAYVFTQQTVK